MHQSVFHARGAILSDFRFECRAVVLKHECALSHHHLCVTQQIGDTVIVPILQMNAPQSPLKLP